MRTEKDSLGEKTISDEALYGVHTARSLEISTSAASRSRGRSSTASSS